MSRPGNHNPYGNGGYQPGQPYGQQPYYSPPQPVTPSHDRRKVVTRSGAGAIAHSTHAMLTLFTCGLWSPIWFLHWLFARKKTVTRY